MRHDRYIYTVDSKRQPPGYSFDTEDYPNCQLIYVTEGQMIVDPKDGKHPVSLEPHSFVLLRYGGIFCLSCKEGGEGYSGFAVFVRKGDPPTLKGPPLTDLADETVRLLAGMIRRHMAAPVEESGDVLSGLAKALVWEILALERERKPAAARDWAAAARTALELNIGTALPVRETLTSLPLSYRQICRCFRDRFGVSPKEYQVLLRIDEARHMLQATDIDITSIATELGYSSSQHFAEQFRRITGSTPTAYRREQRL